MGISGGTGHSSEATSAFLPASGQGRLRNSLLLLSVAVLFGREFAYGGPTPRELVQGAF